MQKEQDANRKIDEANKQVMEAVRKAEELRKKKDEMNRKERKFWEDSEKSRMKSWKLLGRWKKISGRGNRSVNMP